MTNRDHLSPPLSSPPREEQPTNQESFFAAPPEPTSSLIGQEIGSFRLVEIIGRGGFGAVYRAEHLQLRQSFALKLLHLRAETQDPVGQQTIQRFHREARTLAALKHPNIVQISDFGLAHLHYYFVMEYLPGDTLRQRLKRLGPLPLDQIEDIAGQICSALDYIHERGILHRDLKPSNFLLVFDPITQKEQVKLIDFGIASLSDGLSITVAGTFLGSPTYMSPEQAEGRIKAMDARSDLYSLGILVYQMLCGKPPFEGKSMATLLRSQILTPPPPLSEKLPSIPWSLPLERFLKRCLAKNAIDRPVDARLFFSELQAAFHAQRIFLHKSSSPDTSPSLPLNPAYFSDTRDTTVLPAYSQEAVPSPASSPPTHLAASPPLSPRTEEFITATNPALSSSEPSFSLFPTQPQADPPFDAPSDEGLGMTRPREGFAHPSMQTQRRPGFSQLQGGFFQDDEIEGETELDSSSFRSPPPAPPSSAPKPALTASFSDTQVSTPSPVLQDPLAALQALPFPSSPQRPVNPPIFTQSPFPQVPPSGSTPLFSSSPSPSRGILASVPMPSAKMMSPSGGSPASGLSASGSSLPSPSPSASSPPSDEPGGSPSLSSSSSPKIVTLKAFTPSSSPQFSTRIEPAAPDTTLPSAPSNPPTKTPSGSNASASSPRVSASPASSPRIFASPNPSSSSPRLSAGSTPTAERGAASAANSLSPASGPMPALGNPSKPLASPAASAPSVSPASPAPSPFESSDVYKTQVDQSSPIASVSSDAPSFQTQIDRPSSLPSASSAPSASSSPASQTPPPLSSASSFDTQEERVPESAAPSLLKTPATFVVPRNLKPPRKQGRSWWWVGLLLFAAGVGLVLYFFV